ncbi:hypothetical protein Q6267_28820, partial [Klebsiella pneumoniae]
LHCRGSDCRCDDQAVDDERDGVGAGLGDSVHGGKLGQCGEREPERKECDNGGRDGGRCHGCDTDAAESLGAGFGVEHGHLL